MMTPKEQKTNRAVPVRKELPRIQGNPIIDIRGIDVTRSQIDSVAELISMTLRDTENYTMDIMVHRKGEEDAG
nr:MAG TPA: hypothetical protein [Caudoviricetes sp.]